MVRREAHPQRTVPRREAKGRLERQRLAVDAGRDGAVGVDHEGGRRPRAPAGEAVGCSRALEGEELGRLRGVVDPHRHDSELAGVHAWPRAHAEEPVEAIGPVGDHEEIGADVLLTARHGEAQVERGGCGAEQVGQHPQRRAELVVAVPVGLHDGCVDAERDVVHEDRAVDGGQVDAALEPLGTIGVQGADDVVAVNAEIEREVVARARRDAHIGNVVLAGDLGDDRLRPIAAGHAEHTRASLHRGKRERAQVVAGREHDRLDAALLALLGEMEAPDLPAARARVHQQDRAARRGKVGPSGRASRWPQREPGRRRGDGHRDDVHDQGDDGAVADQQHDRGRDGEHGDGDARPPHEAAPDERVQRGAERDRRQGQRRERLDRVPNGEEGQGGQRDRPGGERDEREEALCEPRGHSAAVA